MQFVACTCEYNIAIEPKISGKSVSTDLEPIPKRKSVPKKKIIIIIFNFFNTEFRFGIGSKSVRYRYTESINRYTESRYIVSSLMSIAIEIMCPIIVCNMYAYLLSLFVCNIKWQMHLGRAPPAGGAFYATKC